jgi:hypothetical protein
MLGSRNRDRRFLAALLRVVIVACLALPAGLTPTGALAADPSPSPGSTPTVEPSPTPTAQPSPTPVATPTPAPTPAPVTTITRRLIYRRPAVVRQYTSYWCVPASAQTMINLVAGLSNRSYSTQAGLARQIQRLNRYRYVTRGNDVQGWALTLDARLGGGLHYRDRSYTTQAAAISAIVQAIDRTRHPVGVVVDRGRHAWTVVGYRAATTTAHNGTVISRRILGFYAVGPLPGYRNEPYPYAWLSLDAFKARFSRYHEWQRSVVWEGKWVIVRE